MVVYDALPFEISPLSIIISLTTFTTYYHILHAECRVETHLCRWPRGTNIRAASRYSLSMVPNKKEHTDTMHGTMCLTFVVGAAVFAVTYHPDS